MKTEANDDEQNLAKKNQIDWPPSSSAHLMLVCPFAVCCVDSHELVFNIDRRSLPSVRCQTSACKDVLRIKALNLKT